VCYNLQICEQLFGWLTDTEWEGRQQLDGRIILDSSRHHKVSHQHYGIMGPNKGQHLQKEVPVADMTTQFCDTQLCWQHKYVSKNDVYTTNLSVSCW
jgi:hypothetical protein